MASEEGREKGRWRNDQKQKDSERGRMHALSEKLRR